MKNTPLMPNGPYNGAFRALFAAWMQLNRWMWFRGGWRAILWTRFVIWHNELVIARITRERKRKATRLGIPETWSPAKTAEKGPDAAGQNGKPEGIRRHPGEQGA